MITNISNVIDKHVEMNEKYHRSFVINRKEFLNKLERESGSVLIVFIKPSASDEVVIRHSKADVAVIKQRLLNHAKILVYIILYKYKYLTNQSDSY